MLNDLNDEYKMKMITIYKNFGEDAQYKKLIEEIEEFREELENVYFKDDEDNDIEDSILWNSEAINKLLEETVDCFVVAYQINKIEFLEHVLFLILSYRYDECAEDILIFLRKKEKVLEIARYKIDRTLERIKTGYYEKPKEGIQ